MIVSNIFYYSTSYFTRRDVTEISLKLQEYIVKCTFHLLHINLIYEIKDPTRFNYESSSSVSPHPFSACHERQQTTSMTKNNCYTEQTVQVVRRGNRITVHLYRLDE